jgi:hypothetical protein
MDSDEDKFYMKLVVFDKIYNFVVQFFFIWSHLEAQKIDILSRSGGGRLVLLIFETVVYFCKMDKNKFKK